MNRYPEAEAAFRRLTEVSPEDVPAHFMLGFVLYREDALEKAHASFRRLLELSPNHAEGRYYLGMSLLKLGDGQGAKEALQAFQRALEIQPDLSAAEVAIAEILASRNP